MTDILIEDFSGLPEQPLKPAINSTIDSDAGIFTNINIKPHSVIKADVGIRLKDDTDLSTVNGLYLNTMVITDPICAYIRDNVIVRTLTYAETHDMFNLRKLPCVNYTHNCKFVFRKNPDGSETDIVDLVALDFPIRKHSELCVDLGFAYYSGIFIVKRLFDMKYKVTNWSP